MTESASPMAAFVSRLLSLGHAGQELADLISLAEAAFRSSGSEEERRLRERLRKADWRRRNPGHVPGRKPEVIFTDTVVKTAVEKKERKSFESIVPGQSGTPDDWPADFLEQFWKTFPPYRRQAKAKVAAKLARIRSQKVTWETLFGGVLKFAATNPGEFAPAPMVWLNDGRWDREYGGVNAKAQTAGGGKVGFSGIGARLRGQVESDREPTFDEPSFGSGR